MERTSSSFSLTLPRSWQELTAAQLEYVYKLLAMGKSPMEIKLMALLRWNGMVPIAKDDKQGCLVRILSMKRKIFRITARQLAEATLTLDWMDEMSAYPIRPEKIGKHHALPEDMQGVPFETLLVLDNLYQGYLYTKSDDMLDELGEVLYDWEGHRFKPWERVAIFYWMASLKNYLAHKFPTFYRPTSSSSLGNTFSPKSVEEAMNTQIRALTKGDISKEKEVLAMDCHRALAELEAQARDYEEIKKSYKQ